MIVIFAGLRYALDVFYQIFKILNSVLIQINNTSILTQLFKYCITFPCVGFVLTAINSPRGKVGHIIGKVLYFIVGYIVGFVLDYIARILF